MTHHPTFTILPYNENEITSLSKILFQVCNMMTHDMRQVWNVDRTKADKATVIGRIRDLCPEVEFQAVFYKRKEI